MLARLQDDFTISIAQFQSLAAEYNNRPEGEEAQKDLGARFYLADKYSEAADSYQEFIKDYPKSSSLFEIHYWYASSLLALDKNQDAVDEYRKVLDKAKDSSWAPKSLLGMGNAYFKMKKYSDAEKQYLRILDQYHFYDELNLVYLKLGQTYEGEKKYKEAHGAYQSLVETFPKSMEVSEAKDHMRDLEKAHLDLPQVMASVKEEPTSTPVAAETPSTTVAVMATPTPEVAVQEVEAVSKPFHVQVGVFSKKLYVDKARQGVKKAGYKSYVVTVKAKDMPYPMYKVRVGNFEDKDSAQKLANVLTQKLKEKAIVVED
jgi:tetratricopeptide (TPR) repeat protein